ncbi:hypothetical protein M0R45_000136 [Rubus argutus]|uniref:Uncharacterized protein n=1 Tax=Rubus argutus TaxID=59490 RepID=A0AAW1VRY9_RUBAR
MRSQVSLLSLLVVTVVISGAQSATFTFTNNCPFHSLARNPNRRWRCTTIHNWCSSDASGKFTCASGDCGSGQVACNGAGAIPPASLVELTLAANSGQDFYDVSLVDGFNVPIQLAPQGGSGECTATSCAGNINSVCPAELVMKGRSTVAPGDHGTPETCPPTDYSKIFKSQCPQAYSYAYDDKSSTFTCNGGPNYLVTFCP